MSTDWLIPPADLILEAGDVHVWRASLDHETTTLTGLLSPDERDRAGRFVFERDRNRYIVARGNLRLLLSRYVHRAPAAIVFTYSSRGKPALAENLSVEFNVSHSNALALYAFTLQSQIGVDVEYLGRVIGGNGIAERFFSPQEVAALRQLPAGQYMRGFFNCWTRKEAYVKANGEGIAAGLDQFSVSVSPEEPARLLETRLSPEDAADWSLIHLDPGPDYVGAVAVRGVIRRVCCWSA